MDSRAKAKVKAKAKARSASPRASPPAAARATREDVLSIFNTFDLNGDGKIMATEFAKVLQFLDAATWTDRTIDRLFQAMDADRNGAVDREELINWVFNARGALRRKYDDALEQLPRWTELVEQEAAEAARALEEAMAREALRDPHERRADACAAIVKSISNGDLSNFFDHWVKGGYRPLDALRIHWTALWHVLVLMYGEPSDEPLMLSCFDPPLFWDPPPLDEADIVHIGRCALAEKMRLIHIRQVLSWGLADMAFHQNFGRLLRDMDHAELARKMSAGGAKVREIATFFAFPFFGSKVGVNDNTGLNDDGRRRYANGERVTKCIAQWLQTGVRPVVPEELMAEAEAELRGMKFDEEYPTGPDGWWF